MLRNECSKAAILLKYTPGEEEEEEEGVASRQINGQNL